MTRRPKRPELELGSGATLRGRCFDCGRVYAWHVVKGFTLVGRVKCPVHHERLWPTSHLCTAPTFDLAQRSISREVAYAA